VVSILIAKGLSETVDLLRCESLSLLIDFCVGILVLIMQVTLHWADHGNDRVMESFARLAIEGLPKGALLFALGDAPLFSTMAVAFAANVRPDLFILSANMLLSDSAVSLFKRSLNIQLPGDRYGYLPGNFNAREFLDTIIKKHGLRVFYIGSRMFVDEDHSFADAYAVRLAGISNEIIPKEYHEKISDALFF